MEYKEVVIKRRLLGNILMVIVCAAFVAIGFLAQQHEELIMRLCGILSIIFFGGGGILYIVLMAWKPIAIISSKGITVPYGKGKIFVLWENVAGFKVVEQTVRTKAYTQKLKYIGVFAYDKEGIAGSGKISQALTKKVTGWNEVPEVIINLSFSFVKINKVMEILQRFYDEFGNSQRT